MPTEELGPEVSGEFLAQPLTTELEWDDGGAIVDVVRYASLMALDAGSNVIRHGDLIRAIRRFLR